MDIIYRMGQASAAEVLAQMADPPTYSAVRALLRVLEEKGHLTHKQDGPRYIFVPKRPRQQAARSALRRVLNTFFGGSPEKAVAALLDVSDAQLSQEELDRLAEMIEKARKEGK
jgi:predicted transcriptional regulator